MFWSIAPLVVACIALAGMLGMCSFAPQGPGRGPAPQYDAPAALKADAAALHIPIRVPELPSGWHANSGSRGAIEAGRTDPVTKQPVRALTSKVGYLTAAGMFVALIQSNADEEKLVAEFVAFMAENRMWWLAPILIVILALMAIIVVPMVVVVGDSLSGKGMF